MISTDLEMRRIVELAKNIHTNFELLLNILKNIKENINIEKWI